MIVFASKVHAQFTVPGSFYMQSPILVNPAATGNNQVFSVLYNYRNQWMGFPGSPVNQHFAFHAPMPRENVALGLIAVNESIGVSNRTSAYVSYAYRIKMDQYLLSLGVWGGFNSQSEQYGDLEETAGDPLFQEDRLSFFIPNMGAGILIKYQSNYFIGFSVPEFLHYNYSKAQVETKLNHFSYIATAGAGFRVLPFMALEPSVMVAVNELEGLLQYYALNTVFLEKYVLGGMLKLSDDNDYNLGAYSAMIMFRANPQTDIGLAYDINNGRLARFSNGSLEVLLRYQFSYKIRSASPRDF